MQTYTQGGYTPQQQQLAASQPNSANSQAPANAGMGFLQNDLSQFPSDQALSGQYEQANKNLVSLGTADKRQEYITNSNLPAMYSNYEDLARKLFEYDTGVLNPKFAGTNPGMPSDAASFGRVEASPLGLTTEAAGLSADKGLWSGYNPKAAYSAQSTQAESLASLLNTLNRGIGDTLGARIDTYRSDRQAAQDALDSVFKIMGLKKEVADSITAQIEKEKERQERAAERAATKGKESTDKTQAIWDQIYANATNEYDIWKAINENQDAWRSSGVDVNQLWKWHKNLATRVGKSGGVSQGLKEKIAKLPAKEKETVITLQGALEDIKRARTALDKSGSGPQYQAWQVRQYVPGGLGDAAESVSTMSSVNKNLFKVAGTAFTKTEKDLIAGAIVDPAKDIRSNKAALDEWERSIKGKLKGYGISIDGGSKTSNPKDPLGIR